MAVNQIKVGAIISYIALFLNVLIGLLYTPWLINTIGKSDFGLYTLAMSIIGLLAFDFGLGNATSKFISQYLAEDRQDKVNDLVGMIYKLYLIIDVCILLIMGVLFFFLPHIYSGLTPEELDRFTDVFLIAALFCVISFPFIPQNGILNSYEKFVQLKSCDLFNRLFIVLTMSLCLVLGYGLYALVLVNSISGILTILIKQWIIQHDTKLRVNFSFWGKSEIRTILTFTFWVTVVALSQRMIFNIAPSILGVFSDSKAIAALGIAITLESYVYLIANALNGMFLPRVSRLMVTDGPNEVLELMIKIGRIQIYIIGFILILFIAFGHHFIQVWIGDEYDIVYPCFVLIALPSFLHLPQEIGLTYLVAANKVKNQAYIYIFMAVINLLLAIPLTILYGGIGLCFAIFIAYVFRTICLDYLFYKDLKLNVWSFFKKSYAKLFLPLVVVLLCAYIINVLFHIEGWLGLIIKGLFYTILYVFMVYVACFDKYEKDLFLKTIRFVKIR